ncbi:hypothetical protein E4U43_001168 [Claviceps pusilla]|uniref:LPD1-dihydrolipoamide dehydrogenase n=1 Tax=Claviceps pusilla TaxID=123648 RepID=A0A9P7SYH0_9HYPO|nr:hypothetical protein E4U43_001168 [Claviceps pusilla]
MSTHYDAVVIGSGQGGTPLSMAFATSNKKTALIEGAHIGGCCVNEGCTPTKTMIASGRVAYLSRRGPDYGVHMSPSLDDAKINPVRIDMEQVRARKRDMVERFRTGSEQRVRDAGVEVLAGTARFRDEKTLEVRGKNGHHRDQVRVIRADRIFICTGERPATPALEAFDRSSLPPDTILDSTSVQELGEVPAHLVVVGGGYIGLEFGQLFRRLGAEVTIVQRAGQLVPREDAEIAQAMVDILRQDDVRVLLKTRPVKIERAVQGHKDAKPATGSELSVDSGSGSGSGSVLVSVAGPDGMSSVLRASHVLFAAGRVPDTDGMNLTAAGIRTTSRGYIIVDEQLRTSNPRVWALGDVKGPPAFTHVSYDDYRLLRANLLDRDSTSSAAPARTTVDRILPYVVYTDPQLGHVGLHEHEARAKFPSSQIQIATMPMSYVARALETDEPRGLMKAVVHAETQRILGFTCLGLEGGEIMSVVQMAMISGCAWTALRDAVWAHPSLAESLNSLWGMLK